MYNTRSTTGRSAQIAGCVLPAPVCRRPPGSARTPGGTTEGAGAPRRGCRARSWCRGGPGPGSARSRPGSARAAGWPGPGPPPTLTPASVIRRPISHRAAPLIEAVTLYEDVQELVVARQPRARHFCRSRTSVSAPRLRSLGQEKGAFLLEATPMQTSLVLHDTNSGDPWRLASIFRSRRRQAVDFGPSACSLRFMPIRTAVGSPNRH
jgi:hypothetical protein